MQKTFAPNPDKIKKEWVFIDAKNKILGKLAADIAQKLMAKDKGYFTPNEEIGSRIVVTNAKHIAYTGDKPQTKIYYRYTGFPKGLRSQSLEDLLSKKPTEALRKAVAGMLPKNKLQKKRLANLHIYGSEEHPHKAQQG